MNTTIIITVLTAIIIALTIIVTALVTKIHTINSMKKSTSVNKIDSIISEIMGSSISSTNKIVLMLLINYISIVDDKSDNRSREAYEALIDLITKDLKESEKVLEFK
jgi:hypothetical protein